MWQFDIALRDRGLERQPRLPAATRTGESHETGPVQDAFDALELFGTPDERGALPRKICASLCRRTQRRMDRIEALDHQLEDRFGFVEVLGVNIGAGVLEGLVLRALGREAG